MNQDPRSVRETPNKDPHSISLKVLRLSRPSLVSQHPLPKNYDPVIPQFYSLAYPEESPNNPLFAISPVLQLPQSFGAAYVGQMFFCSLCANNELSPTNQHRKLSSVFLRAEIQTPTQTIQLDLSSAASESPSQTNSSNPGSTLQQTVSFDLKEQGQHVLNVTVTYTEAAIDPSTNASVSSRTRTFRKLYQFLVQPCLGVRTKSTELTTPAGADDSANAQRYVLEAQLENLSDGLVVLEAAVLDARPPFRSTSLNWDMLRPSGGPERDKDQPKLSPSDVYQVAFLVEQQKEQPDDTNNGTQTVTSYQDGRTVLGQLTVKWRGAMGEPGTVSTGNLLARKRA